MQTSPSMRRSVVSAAAIALPDEPTFQRASWVRMLRDALAGT